MFIYIYASVSMCLWVCGVGSFFFFKVYVSTTHISNSI